MDQPHLDHHTHRHGSLLSPHSRCFLIPTNGTGPDHHNLHHPPSPAKLEISDIEMISFQSVAYTSLRDLIPSQPHPPLPGITSPTNNSSWSELPIRNPLVKQAALAYLQPMSTPPESGHKGLLGRLRERCGCLRWLRDAVLVTLRDVFRGVTAEGYEEDDNDDEKVD